MGTGLTERVEIPLSELRKQAEEDFVFFLTLFQHPKFLDDFHGDLARWLQGYTAIIEREKGRSVDSLGIPYASRPQDSMERVRLRVTLPRGFIKTRIVTVLYTLWRIVRDRKERVLIVSNTDRNARSMVAIIKSYFERNDLFREMFPDLRPLTFHHHWSDERIKVRGGASDQMEGNVDAVGVGANITGRHYTMIIEDDTISPQIDDLTGEMYVPRREAIEKAIGWHRLAGPLMVPQGGGMRIVVGTRWAYGDLLQYIIENESYESFETACVTDVPSDGDWTQGKAVFKNAPMEVLKKLREDLGAYFFSALYLNSPIAESRRLFRAEEFRWFGDREVPGEAYRVICIDPAFSKSTTADYTAITCCAHSPGAMYVLHASRDRLSPADIVKKALDVAEEYNVSHMRFEAISGAATLVPTLKDGLYERSLGCYLEEVKNVKGSKIDRICGLQPFFERGIVRMRKSQAELQTELLEFNPETHVRQGKHDDLMDSLSMHIPIYRRQFRIDGPAKKWNGKFTYDWLLEQCKGLKRYHGETQRYGMGIRNG